MVANIMWWTLSAVQFGGLVYLSFFMTPEQAAIVFDWARMI